MTADRMDPLLHLRAEMDDVNRRLCAVLHERARLCRRIAAHKRAAGLPLVDAAREQTMLQALLAAPADGFDAPSLEGILRSVFTASRAIVAGEPNR